MRYLGTTGIEAEVYKSSRDKKGDPAYYVRVTLHIGTDLLTIAGIRVLESKTEGIFVGYPGYWTGRFHSYIEFTQPNELKRAIEEECLKVAEERKAIEPPDDIPPVARAELKAPPAPEADFLDSLVQQKKP